MALPLMSKEDRERALDNAKRARTERAELLRRVAAEELTIAQVLELADENESYARIKASALIKAMPGYGDVKALRLMQELGIAESRRLKGLGFKQRAALVEHFS